MNDNGNYPDETGAGCEVRDLSPRIRALEAKQWEEFYRREAQVEAELDAAWRAYEATKKETA